LDREREKEREREAHGLEVAVGGADELRVVAHGVQQILDHRVRALAPQLELACRAVSTAATDEERKEQTEREIEQRQGDAGGTHHSACGQ
jgi:hypothetical protein